ncbi:MAG: hypothetical protein Q7T03_08210 [Deltaproteobacteria bacterium]|nr:hypothetical protein [Deltaproteobacteria bacterium]
MGDPRIKTEPPRSKGARTGETLIPAIPPASSPAPSTPPVPVDSFDGSGLGEECRDNAPGWNDRVMLSYFRNASPAEMPVPSRQPPQMPPPFFPPGRDIGNEIRFPNRPGVGNPDPGSIPDTTDWSPPGAPKPSREEPPFWARFALGAVMVIGSIAGAFLTGFGTAGPSFSPAIFTGATLYTGNRFSDSEA